MDKLHEIIARQRDEHLNGDIAQANRLAARSTVDTLSTAAVTHALPNKACAGLRVGQLLREYAHD